MAQAWQWSARCGALVFLVLAVGCAKFDLAQRIPWGAGKDGQLQPPMRLVAMWTDDVLTVGGRQPARGFGGRLMFYASESGKPIKTKGTLTVYAFDETNRDPTDPVPDRKYVFTPEQFTEHYSKSPLGHSYSFWIPWDEVGGERKDISLIARFIPEQGGGALVGEQSKHILPGRNPVSQYVTPRQRPMDGTDAVRDSDPAAGPLAADVAQTGYWEGAAQDAHSETEYAQQVGALDQSEVVPPGDVDGRKQMNTTTIQVRPRFGRRAPTAIARPRPPRDAAAAANVQAIQTANQPMNPQPMNPMGQPEYSMARHPSAQHHSASSVREPKGRFAPERSQALGEPISRLERGRSAWQPPRAIQPVVQSPEHRSNQIGPIDSGADQLR